MVTVAEGVAFQIPLVISLGWEVVVGVVDLSYDSLSHEGNDFAVLDVVVYVF